MKRFGYLRLVLATLVVVAAHVVCSGAESTNQGNASGTGNALQWKDNGNGTITDNKTSLMWEAGEPGKKMSFREALQYVKALRLGGYTNWRLPTSRELEALSLDRAKSPGSDGAVFAGRQPDTYWSSSSGELAGMRVIAVVNIGDGQVTYRTADDPVKEFREAAGRFADSFGLPPPRTPVHYVWAVRALASARSKPTTRATHSPTERR